MTKHAYLSLVTAALFAAGCDDSTPNNNGAVDSGAAADAPAVDAVAPSDVQGSTSDVQSPGADVQSPGVDVVTPTTDVPAASDAPVAVGDGTCASPVDLATAGTMSGADLVYRGTTAGHADMLHPYEGCVMTDAAEVVMRYRVPAGVQALKVTSEGSAYDTVVYVRSACSQSDAGTDIACNNDSYDHAPQSTVYVTNAIEGQVLFLVVDGNRTEDSVSSGAFTLTVHPVTFGASGMPCRAVTDPPTARCDGALRCSEGGGADGTALCVPTAANGAACDPRLFNNICLEGSTCVTDPAPPEGMMATSVCALPGTRRGAPCRAAEPRCDAPYACGAGESPTCVPVLSTGIACDMTGEGNRCAAGLTCSPLGDGGMPICHS